LTAEDVLVVPQRGHDRVVVHLVRDGDHDHLPRRQLGDGLAVQIRVGGVQGSPLSG
jgi:hypothetical protein